MLNYQALVHFQFKKGMEEQGVRFLENELIKNAQKFGAHHIELLQNDRDPTSVVGVGVWDSIEDARRFQSLWEPKEKELLKFCTGSPKREFFKIRNAYTEKVRKAA